MENELIVEEETPQETRQMVLAEGANPMVQLVSMAISNNMDVDKIIAASERWDANEARKAYMQAMSDFKKNALDIVKNKTVSFGKTNYKHATLHHVCDVVTEGLGQYDLSHGWSCTQENGLITVTCKLSHAMGHSETNSITAPKDDSGSKNAIQQIGSTITYLERYTLLAAVGMAARDQDDDGNGKGKNFLEFPSEELIQASKEYADKGFTSYRDWFQSITISDKALMTTKGKEDECSEHDKRKLEAQQVDIEMARKD